LKVEESLKLSHQSECILPAEQDSSLSLVGEIIDPGSNGNRSATTKSGIFSRITSRLVSIIPPRTKKLDVDNEMDKEILDAARLFIYSGFWDENNGLSRDTTISDTPAEEFPGQNKVIDAVSSNPVASDEPLANRLISNPLESVKMTVAVFVASTLFSRGGLVATPTCWRELGSISKILSDGAPNKYNPAFCSEVSRALQNNFVIANMICVTVEELQQMIVVKTDGHNYLFKFLLSHLLECSRQIGKQSCAALFSLTMMLLQDLNRSLTTVGALNTELAVIMLIAGYLGGAHDFIYAVLEENESIFKVSFEMAANAFPNIV
jgi:hypothetical protein